MKKIMLLLLVVIFYQTVEAQDENLKKEQIKRLNDGLAQMEPKNKYLDETELDAASCEAKKKELNADKERLTKAVSPIQLKDGSRGSATLQRCVELSKGKMRSLYKEGGARNNNFDWIEELATSPECMKDEIICNGKARAACINNLLDTLALRCDAAAYLISVHEREWTNPEHVKLDPVKGGNPEIRCKGEGIETLDYEGCVKFVNNGDIMDVAQSAIQQGQQLIYQDKAMTAQMEASSSPESATAGLKALHAGVKGQEEIATQRAALDSGKLAALANYYSQIPTFDSLADKCQEFKLPADLADPAKAKKACQDAISNHNDDSSFAFLENQQAREKMKSKLAKVGIDVASDAVMATLMSKRAGDINNAIAKINTFKPIDPLAPAENNLQTTYCQQNPGDAKCLTGGLEQTFDAMGENVITFGEGGTGTSYANTNPNLDTSTGLNNAVGPDGKTPVTSIGSVISASSQKGGLENIVGAATVSKGSASGAGGGGGGGSGGGGSGGGGAPPAGQQAGGNTMGIPGKAPSYGGGGGTLSMMGGLGLNKSKAVAKDDANPFGKLFNKDANKSGAVDFGRSPSSQKVGNKTDNLFDMISKRYTNVSTDKRLIEYEMTK